MIIAIAGLVAGLIGLGFVFYLVAGGVASFAVSKGLPASYGAAIGNVVTLLLVVVMISATLMTIAERKWSALIQNRIGCNRIRVAGSALAGIPFFIADAVKMLTKERFQPDQATRFLFNLAPVISFAPVFALFAIIPVGKDLALGEIFAGAGSDRIAVQIASPDAGLLYLFAIASLAVYGTSLAGWASNNKLALLGGVRAASQMISYEVSLGLALVGTMIAYRSLRLEEMVVAQGYASLGGIPNLGIVLQPVGFLIFFASAFAETKRAPFDLPEGESEIVGYFLEYSGMQFGLMMLSEFVEIVVLSATTVALFFGGWHPIFFEETLKASLSPLAFAAVGAGAFLGKMVVLMWVQMLIRWVLPRFRYDQIQGLCWKILLPVALTNIFITAAAVLYDPSLRLLAAIGIAELVAVFAITAAVSRQPAAAGAHGHGDHGHDAHGHAPAAAGH
jgi:NADH-quinone oxidoreductase subunit H